MSNRGSLPTGGQAIIDAARANGMTTLFGVPGAQIYPLFDALHGTDVELIVPRHEQAAATIGSRFANPDFVRLAESFDVAARRVHEPRELQLALEQELAAARPALIEVALAPGAEASPWPYIHMRQRPSELLRA